MCIYNHLKYGRGRTLNNGSILRTSASQVLPDVSAEEVAELPELSPVPSIVLSTLPIPTPMSSASCVNISRTPLYMDGRRRNSQGLPTSQL